MQVLSVGSHDRSLGVIEANTCNSAAQFHPRQSDAELCCLIGYKFPSQVSVVPYIAFAQTRDNVLVL